MRFILTVCFSFFLLSCSQDKNTIIVGTIAGPETELMEVAKDVAKKDYDLTIKIKTFSDYVIPNIALNDGSLDANVYQHLPYLESAIEARGYHLVSIGKTFIFPMAAYSKKIKSINALPENAIVAIPNDPSNEARALLLLQKAGLIKLDRQYNATVLNIVDNPKHLQFKTLSAAQLPRSLDDASLAVINTNFAVLANLSPKKDGLIIEDKKSAYANIIVVRTADKNKKALHDLVKALHSQAVMDKAKALFHGEAIPAWI